MSIHGYEGTIEQLEENNKTYESKINILLESSITYSQLAKNCKQEAEEYKKLIQMNNSVIGLHRKREEEMEDKDAFMAQFDDPLSP